MLMLRMESSALRIEHPQQIWALQNLDVFLVYDAVY